MKNSKPVEIEAMTGTDFVNMLKQKRQEEIELAKKEGREPRDFWLVTNPFASKNNGN